MRQGAGYGTQGNKGSGQVLKGGRGGEGGRGGGRGAGTVARIAARRGGGGVGGGRNGPERRGGNTSGGAFFPFHPQLFLPLFIS